MDAPNPMKKPNTLDVPIASFGGMLFLIKKGTNKVAPPIPTMPEIIEKAFQLAESGQPGPVLVNVPMDIFSKKIDSKLF